MESAAEAAHYMRLIWQGHDERSEEMCESGAFGLYEIISPSALGYNKAKAAQLVREAFWSADEAEHWQRKSATKESQFYQRAGEFLEESRTLVGLETESVRFTMEWWKAYRHKDYNTVLENLVKEHLCQLNCEDKDKVAADCTERLIEAAEEHKKRNWETCEVKLKAYFEMYLPALSTKI